MTRVLEVGLSAHRVGRLVEGPSGQASFRILEAYRRLVRRPVLSQSFEDDLTRPFKSRRDPLPTFFSNALPEGALRQLIEKSLNLPEGDDLEILAAVGADLPGAVTVARSADESLSGDDGDTDPVAAHEAEAESDQKSALRFSLAGVQLKFSVIRQGETLTLPAHGGHGTWLVKLDSSSFPRVVENEFSTLEWARRVGFPVPECQLVDLDQLAAPLRPFAGASRKALAIRRYDREGDRRIHQEDFAQAIGLPPRLKYDHATYEELASLVRGLLGEEGYLEFVRRLVFVVVSGNADAHLKNWSLVYPDGVAAALSPLYDQVSTIAWPEITPELSLKLAGAKRLSAIDERTFERLAKRAGAAVPPTVEAVRETLEKSLQAWRDAEVRERMPPDHQAALEAYWASSPLIRPFRG